MNLDFLDRRSAERFAELLDENSGGRRHHSRGAADAQLAELVAIGHSLSAARSGVRVDSEFRVGLRAMLVATAERDGIGTTATETETEPGGGHAAVRETRRSLFGRGAGRRIRARGAIVIGVAAGAVAVSGISAASENAAPGDALYGVKRSTERAQLAMAGSDVTRGQLSLDFARTRLAEAGTLTDAAEFAGVLDDMDADTRQGVKLLTESAVARRDVLPLDRVDSFVTAQKLVFAPMLDRLSPARRERADVSLGLLNDVAQRSGLLRSGLACDPGTTDGADALGPKLLECMTGTDASEPDEQEAGQGEPAHTKQGERSGSDATVAPERTAPAIDGNGVAETVAPDDAEPTADTRSPGVQAPTTSPPAAPPPDENKGLLGDILEGIL
ncbi:MAG TPA: DUF5667 domain-containing protein [Actinoplanes sp.]|nr:DUF5667 domain-containing protein [Actinoplanes sp.]